MAGPPSLRKGGWTGFWTVVWAACVGFPVAFLAATLVVIPLTMKVLRLGIEQAALQEGVPGETVLAPADEIVGWITDLTDLLQPWVFGVTAICVTLIVAGVRLAAGTERGRLATRWLLALLVLVPVAAGLHASTRLLPTLAARSAAIQEALRALARQSGGTIDLGAIDSLFDARWLAMAIWAPIVVVSAPTACLWLAAGRRALVEWCASRPAQ